jgi:hypothetical protein
MILPDTDNKTALKSYFEILSALPTFSVYNVVNKDYRDKPDH